MEKTLFQIIQEADCITIFRHIHPDWDAIGAQLGLKTWIQETYPEKKVYALGDAGNFNEYQKYLDEVDNETITSSIAIVVDCANHERVDDLRFQTAKKIIKIDHHPEVDHYGDMEIVKVSAGATCEIVTNLFRHENIKLSKKCASFLYQGLLMDTARFSINNTTRESFLAAAYLCEAGIDLPNLSEACISLSLNEYAFVSFLRSHMQIYKNKIAYAILEEKDYESMGLSFEQAKDYVYIFNHINELSIWTLFTRKPGSNSYKGSLRSRKVVVNDIAANYHGGGHVLAAGVTLSDKGEIDSLLETLYQRLIETNE